ncbi:MAG: SpoIIE family protein phosphatase [Oscillospiraceae bacterium]|jgi:stage II sporulation protein E|nr:SpoIIE family protein phosphatase [Oscillospiraceae bacterium]
MAVKQETGRGSAAIVGLMQLKDRPQVRSAAGYVLNFILGFIMSGSVIMEGLAPFGIAIVGRARAGWSGISCLIGACLGYILLGGFDWGIKYVATITLVFTVAFVFRETRIIRKAWFMPAAVSAVTAVTSFLNTYEFLNSFPNAVGVFTELVLAGAGTYFFSVALTPQETGGAAAEHRQAISLLLLFACLLMSLARVEIMGAVSIGRLLALLIVFTAAFKGGMLPGCAAGTALGLAMDMASGGGAFFVMAYSFAGLIGGTFSKHGRLLFLVSYIMANTVAVLWTWGGALRFELMCEVFAATLVFAMLPDTLLEFTGGIARLPASGTGESGLRRYAAARAERIGTAFRDLYGTVFRNLSATENDNDIATVFDRAAGTVCAGCKNKDDCWQKNFMDTLSIMNDATGPMLRRGKLVREDLAERFTDRCPSCYTFISTVNSELRGLMYRRQFRSRLNENRVAAYGQYKELADIIEGVARELNYAKGADPLAERRLKRFLRAMGTEADVSVFRDDRGRLRAIIESGHLGPLLRQDNYLEILSGILGTRLCRPPADEDISDRRLVVLEAEPLVASVGIAGVKKKGEPVSGDRGTYFKTDQGVLCVILADGMGSGEKAAKESINAVKTLEAFLRAGVDPAVAMKILNSVLLLKNGEEWGYSTIDLMCVDLFTGETSFYKYGAAPSFVKNGKAIRRVRCESLAAGVCAGEGSAPDIIRMRLKPGNVALIASDGVLVENSDAWLREMLIAGDGVDTKTLAKETLRAAVRQFGCEDDMTVLAVRVDRRA